MTNVCIHVPYLGAGKPDNVKVSIIFRKNINKKSVLQKNRQADIKILMEKRSH